MFILLITVSFVFDPSAQARYDEVANEMKSMLVKVGWKKDFIEKNTPVMPISGWMGDNLLKKSENMGWWKGQDVEVGSEKIHVDTVYDVLDKICRVPERTRQRSHEDADLGYLQDQGCR